MQEQQNIHSIIPEQILWKSIDDIWNKAQAIIKPKPLVTVSEFADADLFLSPEDSKKALMGDTKFSHDGFEYLKGFEDAFNNPLIKEIYAIKSGQTGFTRGMINQWAWSAVYDPGPSAILYPTENNAKKFNKRKLAPAIRDTPVLRDIISDSYLRDGNNSEFEKTYLNGFLSILSGATVNNLAQQSLRYLWIDELDRIARTAGSEGDTVDIIKKRLQGYLEVSKLVCISTPTLASTSRIAAEYETTNKQKYYMPCTHCNGMQILKFAQLKGWHKAKGVYVPEETFYECEHCKKALYEKDKYVMLKYGNWIAENPQIISRAGFWISELYSTLSTWQYVVEQFIPAKENPFKLQVFVNTVLGETFEDNTSEIPESALMTRAENYTAEKLPEGILILTAAVDFQKDRAESTIIGWGLNEESWVIDHQIFYGNPEMIYDSSIENNLYYRLEQYFDSKFEHETGMYLRILSAGLDTGYATTHVQKFIKKMNRKGKNWIFALQGDKGQEGTPVLNRGSVNNKLRVKQFTVGTATAKSIIFSRLNIDEYGGGYIHFPNNLDQEWYSQLTAEKRVPHYEKGILIRHKWVKIRARNEALDIMVYNLAALEFLNVNLNAVHKNFHTKLERLKKEKQEIENEQPTPSIEHPVTSTSSNHDEDLRKYRRPKKNYKITRQKNFATNY